MHGIICAVQFESYRSSRIERSITRKPRDLEWNRRVSAREVELVIHVDLTCQLVMTLRDGCEELLLQPVIAPSDTNQRRHSRDEKNQVSTICKCPQRFSSSRRSAVSWLALALSRCRLSARAQLRRSVTLRVRHNCVTPAAQLSTKSAQPALQTR